MLFKKLEANYSKTTKELKDFVLWRKKIATRRGLLFFIISFVKLILLANIILIKIQN